MSQHDNEWNCVNEILKLSWNSQSFSLESSTREKEGENEKNEIECVNEREATRDFVCIPALVSMPAINIDRLYYNVLQLYTKYK